jgi:hypothetical protein
MPGSDDDMPQVSLALLLAVLLGASASARGPNLVRDGSSFETGYDGFSSFLAYTWTKHGLAGTNPRRGVIDTSTAAHGTASLKLQFEPPYGRKGFTPWCTFRWMKVKEGQTYTVSLYARGSRSGQQLTMSVADKWQPWGWCRFSLTTEWQRYSKQITMGKTEGGYARVLIPYPEDGPAWIDAVQFEEGRLTDYAPGKSVDLGLSSNHSTKYENLFFHGDEVRLEARIFCNDDGERDLSLEFSVEDYFDAVPYQGTSAVAVQPGHTTVPIPLGTVDRGSYKATVKILDGQGNTLDFEELVFGVLGDQGSRTGGDSQFGLHGFPHPVLEHCGTRWLRTYLLAWSAVEPQEGRFSWPEQRDQDRLFLRNLDESGIKALPVLGVIPPWARSDQPAHGGWSEGQSLDAKIPRLDAWSRYVFETVSRYKDRFSHWEVMNEPSAWMNAEDYVPILKAAHDAAKKADPDCFIVAGDTAWPDSEWLRELVKRGGLDSIDVFCGHFYGVAQSGPPEAKYRGRGADSVIDYLRRVLRRAGRPDLPIWNTEEGTYVPPWYTKEIMPRSHEPWHRVPDVHRQARDMVRSHVIQLANGIRKVFWFYELYSERGTDARLISRPEGMYACEYDGSPRPALVAYSVMTEQLAGLTPYRAQVQWGEKAHCYVFSGDGRSVAVAWHWGEQNTDITVVLRPDRRLVVWNMMGNARDAAAGEKVRLELSGDPVYVQATGVSAEELFKILSDAEVRR